MITLIVPEEESGRHIIELIQQTYPDFYLKTLKAAFKAGNITLDGKEAYEDDEVKEGAEIKIFVSGDIAGIDLTPKAVYQDENFLIVDKPAGLPSVSENEPNVTLKVEELMDKRGELCIDALMVPYLVYPLEKYVSGLLLFAKHEQAYLFLIEALAQRRITRYYICPVRGQAKDKEEFLAYLLDKANRNVRILDAHQKDAKPIVTRYNLVSRGENMSLLRVRPVTNYLHQIRAHLAYEGLPVLGDGNYGDKRFNKKYGAANLSLWLKTVKFETGRSHEYAYMNGRQFESQSMSFPKSIYDEELLKLE